MKKVYTYAMMALMMALTMTTFTSCMTRDEAIAYDLSGEWEGYMGEDYYSYWGYEGTGREYDTIIRFSRAGHSYSRGATSGYGEQVDYDPYNRDSRYREFLWSVAGGRIRLTYDTGQIIYIYDYEINGSRFSAIWIVAITRRFASIWLRHQMIVGIPIMNGPNNPKR